MRRAQPRVANPSGVERPLEAAIASSVTREDGGLRPVDRGDRQAVAGERRRVVFREQHGEHRAARRAAHQPARAARPARPHLRARRRRPGRRRRIRRRCGRSTRPARRPRRRHSRASAYSTAKSAGCANRSAMTARSAPAIAPRTRSTRSSRRASTAASRSDRSRRETRGSAAYRPRAMPAYCAPWPGNMNADLARDRLGAGPSCAAGWRSEPAQLRAPSSARRRRGDAGTRAGRPAGSTRRRRIATPRARRDARPAARARASSAVGVRAESTGDLRRVAVGSGAAAAGASSSTTCALVPPMPNELTPARRGAGRRGPLAKRDRRRRTALDAKSICGFGRSKCRLGGSLPCSSARTVLISPATPAAASRWPTLVFTDPMPQDPRRISPGANARVSAAISIGSPSGVPVPCAST